MEEKKKEETIVLLNDGERSDKEGHCNSWPKIDYTSDFWWFRPYCEP